MAAKPLPEPLEVFERAGFSLASDYARLNRVRASEAHEAAVFYGGRIVEALAADAVQRIGLEAGDVYGNLLVLEQLDLLADPWLTWAHALRRLGNEARHLRRRVGPGDSLSAKGLVATWLAWYFGQFERGPRVALPELEQALLGEPEAQAMVRALRLALREPLDGALLEQVRQATTFEGSPVLSSLLAQRLIDLGRFPEAEALLLDARQRLPDDLRLEQLLGLAWSRAGRLREAISLLEALERRCPQDEETLGILGGAYKRAWSASGEADGALLRKAWSVYQRGFRASRRQNAYLGVNVGTLALLSGDARTARAVGAQIAGLLRDRAARAGRPLEYWNQVSYAEALLLAGELREARRAYHRSLTLLPLGDCRRAVSLDQAARILSRSAVPPDPAFPGEPPPDLEEPTIRVGITGHRRLRDEGVVFAAIDAVRRELEAESGAPSVLTTALAEGADRLAARAWSEAGWPFEAILPFFPEEYAKDFDTPAREAFGVLLGRALRYDVWQPPSGGEVIADRSVAYEGAGRAMVDRCDRLIAVWDGLPACGRGGTATLDGATVASSQWPP